MQLSNLSGKVNWFNQTRGFGVATALGTGEVFLLSSNLADTSQVAMLVPEAHILFSTSLEMNRKTGEDRLVAKNITITEAMLQEEDRTLVSQDIPARQSTGFEFVADLLKDNDLIFNKSLIRTLANGIGEIDNDRKYNAAKQLAIYNQSVIGSYYDKLAHKFYYNAANHYKVKFWLDGIYEKCDALLIESAFHKGDDAQRRDILAKCDGALKEVLTAAPLQTRSNSFEEVYFTDIRRVILEEISKAKNNIYVAVAWFTNHHLFEALCQKVSDGLDVEVIIVNDYINNWIEGLNFQKFIELGKVKGNSKLYFCNAGDKLLHHKFCLIDNGILINGSYNWTYYAEARNIENCIVFKGNVGLNQRFSSEFTRLKGELTLITHVVPFDIDALPKFDTLSVNSYRSNDLLHYAQEVKSTNGILATRLVRQSLLLNPDNAEAASLQNTLPRLAEHELQELGIQNSLKDIRTKQAVLQARVDEENAIAFEQEKLVIEQLEEEKRQDHARELKFKENTARQLEQQRQLLEQKKALESKTKLEEKERNRLLEISNRQKALKAEQEKAIKEKAEREKAAEKQRQAEKKRREAAQIQASILAAKRADEQQNLKNKAAILETASPKKLKGGRGELRINLSWTSLDDLDLHVYDPDENHIYYGEEEHTCQESLGKLDVDANAEAPRTRRPQENVFWSSNPPEGEYSVEVNNYSINQRKNCPFILTVIPAIGEPSVYAGITEGEDNPLKVVKFKYSRSRGLKVISHS